MQDATNRLSAQIAFSYAFSVREIVCEPLKT